MPAAVAIAVVSWNTRDLLARCLESMRDDAEAGRAEVWVVDNASIDGSADLVRERFPWVRLVAGEENLGYGRAVNLVAERTDTPWLAPANADAALHPGALEALLAAGERDPGAGAVAPRLVGLDGTTEHSLYPFPTLGFTLLFNLGLARLSRRWGDARCVPGAWDPERERRAPWAIAAFLLVRRDAWDAVGGFDEAQWMYAEDLDLGWRLHRAGRPTRYVPQARVLHASAAATSQAFGDDGATRRQVATYRWMRRRRGNLLTTAVALTNIAGGAVRWNWHRLLFRFAPRRHVWHRDRWRAWTAEHVAGLRRSAQPEDVPDRVGLGAP